MDKPRIGWVGLGKMGIPMSRHIKSAGFRVTAYIRSDAAKKAAAELDISTANTLAEIAQTSDIVFSAISDDRALLDIISGPAGLASAMTKGTFLVDTSTVSPSASAEVHRILAAHDIGYLRSPVSGSTAAAQAKKLTIMASGPRAIFDLAMPLYQAFSLRQYYVGTGEEARFLKLTLNALVGATSALLAEAMLIGLKGGIDRSTMLAVINDSAVASPLIGYKTKMIETGDYSPAFTLAQMMKDFDIIMAVGRNEHCPLPLLGLVRQQFEAAYAAGAGGEDFFVLAREGARKVGCG